MSKTTYCFFCRCCHREQSTDKQVNRSGYCGDCYGNCILAGHNQCDILLKMQGTKFKLLSNGFVVIDEVSEITTEQWKKLIELKNKREEEEKKIEHRNDNYD